jgi:hypothetical protein
MVKQDWIGLDKKRITNDSLHQYKLFSSSLQLQTASNSRTHIDFAHWIGRLHFSGLVTAAAD